jgi:hypothetical protein
MPLGRFRYSSAGNVLECVCQFFFFDSACRSTKSLTDDVVLSGLSDMYMHRVCDTEHLTSFTTATHTHEQIHSSLLEIPLQLTSHDTFAVYKIRMDGIFPILSACLG